MLEQLFLFGTGHGLAACCFIFSMIVLGIFVTLSHAEKVISFSYEWIVEQWLK